MIASWIWLVGLVHGRLMMLVKFTNIDMIIPENKRYWTWLTIRVKNS